MAQFVDIDTAKEFMKEALGKVSAGELFQICEDLEEKSRFFQENLSRESIAVLDPEKLRAVFKRIFSIRRKTDRILETYGADQLKGWITELLYGESSISERFSGFIRRLESMESNIRYDFASELLHYTMPDHYWLWTRWIWDPKTETGSLPLVITEDYPLKVEGEGEGETYLRIGKALSFVRHVGEAAGFDVIGNNRFGVDAYLCSVYVVYVYTVLRMRMTQEFNKVMPGLAEFSRRLLGIYKHDNNAGASQPGKTDVGNGIQS